MFTQYSYKSDTLGLGEVYCGENAAERKVTCRSYHQSHYYVVRPGGICYDGGRV